jgi:hypothetical protein
MLCLRPADCRPASLFFLSNYQKGLGDLYRCWLCCIFTGRSVIVIVRHSGVLFFYVIQVLISIIVEGIISNKPAWKHFNIFRDYVINYNSVWLQTSSCGLTRPCGGMMHEYRIPIICVCPALVSYCRLELSRPMSLQYWPGLPSVCSTVANLLHRTLNFSSINIFLSLLSFI